MRNIFIVIFTWLLGHSVWSQQLSNDPFSSFGLGDFGGLTHAVFGGMGNANITSADSTILNFYNPASYSSLAKHTPLFSFSTSTRLSIHAENGAENFSHTTNIQHFAIAFPFAKRFGLAFGMKPYSRRGYAIENRFLVNADSIAHRYDGDGSINEAFLGFSATALDFRGAKLSVGANFGYLFGTVRNIRKSGTITPGTTVLNGGVSHETIRAKDIHFEFGLTYEQRINEHHTLSLSGVYDPFQQINGKYSNSVFYASNLENENTYFELSSTETSKGHISNVPMTKLGLRYDWNFIAREGQTNTLNSQLSIHLNYTMSDFKKFENTFDANSQRYTLNATEYNLGIQYTPEVNFIVNKVTTKFYERIRYRIGAYYKTLPYSINSNQITDLGTTFGLGFPVLSQNSLSSINIGLSYGVRGVNDKSALKETYYGVSVGFIIAPSADKWFIKRKLN